MVVRRRHAVDGTERFQGCERSTVTFIDTARSLERKSRAARKARRGIEHRKPDSDDLINPGGPQGARMERKFKGG